MLERIIIKNFKSFSKETTIDFYKTNYTNLPENVSEEGVLKGAMFVGANASGKSNIIEAIRLLLDMMFSNHDVSSHIYKCLFTDDQIYTLKYIFRISGSKIEYGFDIHVNKKIVNEFLIVDKVKMLERLGNSAKVYITNSDGQYYSDNEVNEDTLFLRTVYFNTRFASNPILKEWMEFLSNSVYINVFDRRTVTYKNIDLTVKNYLLKNGSDKLNNFLDEYNFKINVEFTHECIGNNVKIVSGNDENEKDIFIKRKDINEPIPFGLESVGNQNLLHMLPAFLHVVQNNGILLIDEFSSGFHNDLEALLIKYFMTNSKKSQMIFVSHSTNLLRNTLLRPDQEYSVDFSGRNGTVLNRISQEQPRIAQNIEKMYISGVFGGLPNYRRNVDEN